MAVDQITFGRFRLNLDERVLLCDGRPARLGSRAFEVLSMLVQAKGAVVGKEELIAGVWRGAAVEDNNLHVQIAAVRRVLDPEHSGQTPVVSVPGRGYRLIDPAAPAGVADQRPILLPDRPSLAVLPFANLSGDSGQDYIGDGIAEDLITALSRWRWFFVIARNSSFKYKQHPVDVRQAGRELGVRYLVEGSVQASPDRLRITAQFVEAASGHTLWSERLEFERADLFAIEDELARRISASLEPAIAAVEMRRTHRKDPDRLAAWDRYLRGLWYLNRQTSEDARTALGHFRDALRLDDNLVEAYVGIARAYHTEYGYGLAAGRSPSNAQAAEAARAALARDDGHCYAHYILSLVAAHDRDLDGAARAARRAIDLNPSFALAYFARAVATLYQGGPEEALAAVDTALRLSPHDPQTFLWLALRASALYLAGGYGEAIAAAEESRRLRWFYRTPRILAASYAQLGLLSKARAAVAQLRCREPSEKTIAEVISRFERPHDRERYAEGLRKAGFPED